MKAVLNEIDGYDHGRTHRTGTPAVFGMNFQSVSTAQKLPASEGLTGGYVAKGVPGPLLAKNLAFVDQEVGAFLTELRKQHLDGNTTVILSSKHGQSPTDPKALTRIDDGPCSTASTPRGRRPTRAPVTWSPTPWTTTPCSCGSTTARRPPPPSPRRTCSPSPAPATTSPARPSPSPRAA